MKSIYTYKDYQDFLKDFFLQKKKEHPGFSYSVWARKMNLKSSSMLSMVLNNERLPSKAFIKKLSVYLKLNNEEEEYFKTLVNLKKIVKNPRLTVYLNSEASLSDNDKSKNLFASPMTFIIKELLEAKTTSSLSVTWLKENLLIQHQKYNLNEILSELITKEILQKNSEGKLSVVESNLLKVLATPEQIKGFHKAAQEMAIQAYDTSSKEQRAFHTSFVKLKKDRLEEAKRRILEFQRELTSFVEDGTGEVVLYQVNLQLFPLSKTIE